MDSLLTVITARLEAMLEAHGAAVFARDAVGTLTWAGLTVSVVYLCIAVAATALAARLLERRRAAAAATLEPASTQPTDWRRHAKAALKRPLYILIWVYGLYIASTPILAVLTPAEDVSDIKTTLNFLFNVGTLAAFFWFLFRVTRALEARLAIWAATTPGRVDDLLVPLVGATLRVVVVVVGVILLLPLLDLPSRYADVIGKLTSIAFIAAVAILVSRAVRIFQQVVLTRFDMRAADNLLARKVYTQVHVISRVVYVVIGIVAVSAVLMLFQQVRHVGTSLLASAGVVGIIAGFAAQKTLANLFAGFQIALAQPVRQDDVVVVEGEWGRVEEITLTYIVVHIWDDRRLVLPLSYFIEKPFQNWTRTSAALLGSVFIWVDYSFPVEEGRKALKQIIENHPLWDKRFWNLQVTDTDAKSLQLRILATSADSSRSFDLRCDIREHFVAFIQSTYPQHLPRLRLQS